MRGDPRAQPPQPPGAPPAGASGGKQQQQHGAATQPPGSSKAPAAHPVLPWMRVPILIEPGRGVPVEHVPQLDERLKRALQGHAHPGQPQRRRQQVYAELFPVQSSVWSELAGGASAAHDLCIAAPTGSGKTLAYALPVVNGLARGQQGGRLHFLQALVVLPTRDLAVQVHAVFAQLCPAVGLTLGLAAAQAPLPAEAHALMGRQGHPTAHPAARHAAACEDGSGLPEGGAGHGGQEEAGGLGWGGVAGQGCVDVLVATPGRLMAHMQHTRGFTLDHLRFLVVDEADRLLRQSYQEWLPHVLASLGRPSHFSRAWGAAVAGASALRTCPANPALVARAAASTAAPLPASGSVRSGGGGGAGGGAAWDEVHDAGGAGASDGLVAGASSGGAAPAAPPPMPFGHPRPVKVIVSATLTRDPSKLQRLELFCPRYIATSAQDHRYHLPRSLQEFRVMCSGARKPLTLLALLHELREQSTIVFASSLEITHKLFLLLQLVLGGAGSGRARHEVVEFSSNLSAPQRAAALEQLRTGRAKVLVASDAMTRGMDVDNVQNIVNYDAPVYAKTYVHRAGRTARAGRTGRVFTLLRDEDVKHFNLMLRKADNTYVGKHALPAGAADAFKAALEPALVQVRELLEAEAVQDDSMRLAAAQGAQGAKRPAPAQPAQPELPGEPLAEGGQEEEGPPGAHGASSPPGGARPKAQAGKRRKTKQTAEG